MFKKIGEYFGALKGNAKVCIGAHPFWGIPYTIYYAFLSQYLIAVGVTSVQLGQLMVIGTAAGFVFSLISAPLVDRMGRRSSTLVFDLLSSALPPLVYFFTDNFVMALIAQILYQSSRIMNVSYYLVMIEDAEDETRIVAFNLFNIITVVAGLLIPIAGVFVERYGLIRMEKIFLMATFILMSGMILIRHMLLKETKVGKTIREEVRKNGSKMSLRELWKPYGDALRFLWKSKTARAIVLCNIFFSVYMNLGTNYSLYFMPYFTDQMGMGDVQASVLNGVYHAGMIFAMVCINPITGKRGIVRSVVLSAVVSLIGMAMMVLSPSGIYWLAIASVLILAVGYGMLKSGVDGAMAVYSESEFRSGIYSLSNLLASGLGMLVTAICSVMYALFAGWLYILCAVMVVLLLICVLSVRKDTAETVKS